MKGGPRLNGSHLAFTLSLGTTSKRLTPTLLIRFKLHLRPHAEKSADNIRPLPPNKQVGDVFSDYMRYLFQCAREYITETHGDLLWNSLKNDIMFILTHPNGWGGPQQTQMRKSAVTAGLVPSMDRAKANIAFVTEGEASLHFCLSNGLDVPASDDEVSAILNRSYLESLNLVMFVC